MSCDCGGGGSWAFEATHQLRAGRYGQAPSQQQQVEQVAYGSPWFHNNRCMPHFFLRAVVFPNRSCRKYKGQVPELVGIWVWVGERELRVVSFKALSCHGNSMAYLQGSSGQSLGRFYSCLSPGDPQSPESVSDYVLFLSSVPRGPCPSP